MYSSTNQTTIDACKKMHFIFCIRFVETLQRNGKIYVRGTCGHKEDFDALKTACYHNGYYYVDHTGHNYASVIYPPC